MTHDAVRHCSFSTERLLVDEWHRQATRFDLDLVSAVGNILTAATTPELPPEWRGEFDAERAQSWIEARDLESPTLLAVEPEPAHIVGLLILFAAADDLDPQTVDLRIGYVLAESAWGRGFASELVAGLIEWSRSEASIQTISAGVAPSNEASAQVLLKNGFELTAAPGNERLYQISL